MIFQFFRFPKAIFLFFFVLRHRLDCRGLCHLVVIDSGGDVGEVVERID